MWLVQRPIAFMVIPIILGTISFSYYQKRRCYLWRQQLCDNDLSKSLYPQITPDVNAFVRRVMDKEHQGMASPELADNPGLAVRDGFLSEDECAMLRDFARDCCNELGLPLPDTGIRGFTKFLRQCGYPEDAADEATPFSFLEDVRFVSDHHEGEHPPRALWGSGDSVRMNKLPLTLRALTYKIREAFPRCGSLRHVYIERSPKGEFIRTPRPQAAFDGHEYYIIPLFGDDGAVISFSPTKRNLENDAKEVMKHGWSSVDLDVFVPHGSMLHVRGEARFRWAWGVRPGVPFFGNPLNTLPVDGKMVSIHPRTEESIKDLVVQPWSNKMNDIQNNNNDNNNNNNNNNSSSSGFSSWFFSSSSTPATETTATATTTTPEPSSTNSSTITTKSNAIENDGSRSLLVMCFEGPTSNERGRRRGILLEYDAFGEPPIAENMKTWTPDVPPSAEELRQSGLLWFFLSNYPNLFHDYA